MNRYILWSASLVCIALLLFVGKTHAQSPGLIIKPNTNNVGATFLNPNGDKYVYTTAAAFGTNDQAGSEIPYKVVPSASPEPVGDQNNGTNGGATDFVPNSAGNGFYTYFDGANIMFRFRVGGTATGAKAYSVLLDTDLRIGNTGFYADPNYVTQSNPRSGNPGFELEIVYQQGKGIFILNVDGTVNGTEIASYQEKTNSQTSIAHTTTSGDADYFIDFGVPAAALGIGTRYIRMVGTTCSAPFSALNNNSSDVFGMDDIAHKNMITSWERIISVQCGFPVSALSAGGSGICVCTPRPILNSPIGAGTNVAVTGIWNRFDDTKSSQAVITLFKNDAVVSTVTATTGQTWSITVPSLRTGDVVYAKAQASPEFMCLQSDPITVTCVTNPTAPTVSCATDKGINGTIPLNTIAEVFQVINNNGTISYNPIAGVTYINNTTNRTFNVFGSGATGGSNACNSGSPNSFPNGSYMIQTNNNGCLSTPFFFCISGGALATNGTNAITLTTPIYNYQTSVTGSGTTSGNILTLYKNDQIMYSQTAANSSFAFSDLVLKTGDVLRVREQIPNSTCNSFSNTFTVTCFTAPPSISSNNGVVLTTASAITGYSGYTGATVSLYRGSAPGTLIGTATVAANGYWGIGNLTLTVGETYYATQNAGCNSASSNTVTILAPAPICPSFGGPFTESVSAITGTFASAFTGTLRLYHDSALLASVSLTNATTWSIPVNQDVNTLTDKLNPGAKLMATTQTPGWGERLDCGFITVLCDVPPTPAVAQTSATIKQGQTVTFSVTNSSSKVLYSLVDASSQNFAESVFGNDGSQNVQSYVFNNIGTYNLKVAADNPAAPWCRTTTNVTVTVNDISLPLKFVDVAVKSNSSQSRMVSWTVASEENISHYVVERSFDCISFEAIGTANFRPSTEMVKQYSFADGALVNSSTLCYRIKAINADGTVAYSKVVNLSDSKKWKVLLAPNPAKAETTVYISSETKQQVKLELLDVTGRTVLRRQISLSEGKNAVTVDGLGNYPRGHYILKLYAEKEVSHLKLILD